MSHNLSELTAEETARMVRRGEISARSVAEAAIARIRELDAEIGAFLTVTEDAALSAADAVDRRVAAGEDPGPLAGVVVALKDNICTKDLPTTAGSRLLAGYLPPYSATVVERLAAAGAVPIGKTNCDEFAMGSSTENSGYQITRNPWDRQRVPGGSSGGSAAAVAAGLVPLALGSDTGGSIRQPAALCGIVGLKPTCGRVSRSGLIAFASSLDQIGPLSRTVGDAALALRVIAGYDPKDGTSANVIAEGYGAACGGGVEGLRIGVAKEYFEHGVAPEVAERVHAAAECLGRLGAQVKDCSLPSTEYGLASYYILAPAEAASNLARFDGVRYGARATGPGDHVRMMEQTRETGFGDEVKQRIMIGTYVLSAGYYDAYYRKAQQARELIRADFANAFKELDLILTPTSPTTAFRIGEKSDPLAMKLADICTLPASLAGLPSISLCCGFADGLPVGMQLIAAPFAEAFLFRAAAAYEQATPWHRARPGSPLPQTEQTS